MSRIAFVLSALAVVASTAPLDAQMTTFVPDGFQTVEGNTTWPYPFNFTNTNGIRTMLIYDSSNFTGQGRNGPISITRLRWRANGGSTCTGRTWNNVAIHLSTAPIDYLAMTNTFANNHGANLTTVFSGPVTVNPIAVGTTPGSFFVDIALTTPFLYDPGSGLDLAIDIDHDGTATTGTSTSLDLVTTGSLGSLMFTTASRTAATVAASSVRPGHGMMMEIGWTPPAGLAAGFAASPRTGTSPLTVAFADQSYSTDPSGVIGWSWDFDNDNIVDSILQNPTFTYNQCGSYAVSLTVFDTTHPPQSHVRTDYVVTDTITVGFTKALLVAPNVWQFTDTSTPTPQAWAWDFDGDNITDSTLQNPAWAFAVLCSGQTVRLDATQNCRVSRRTQDIVVAPATLSTSVAGGGGLNSANTVGNMFDVSVTAPGGISVCALTMTPYTFFGPFTATIYVAADSYVGNHATAAAWRQVATGIGRGVAGGFNPPTPVNVPLASPFYLPAGNYGVAIYISGVPTNSLAYTTVAHGPFANADLTLFPNPALAPGIAKSGLFTASTFNGRWNGAFHYSTIGNGAEAGYGWFGAGCPGSMAVTHLVSSGPPELGSVMTVNLDNLPLSVAILMVGFSRTTSSFGPLPLDMALFGAPGCSGRVSPDATSFLFGAGNTAGWVLGIPNDPALLAVQMFNQALVPDPGFNALGGVLSDAAAMIVGN